MIDTARNFAGSIPDYYDWIMGPAHFRRFADDLVQRIPKRPPGDVLELACGTGIVTRRLRERLDPSVRVVASDISRAMLDYASKKLDGAIEWRTADAQELPFDNARFGALVCAFGIMFVPDRQLALREAHRVLIVEHVPPCFSVNFAGCKDASTRIELMALSAPTPETPSTTHYYFGFVRDFGLGEPAIERVFDVDLVKVFNEDIPVLEAQQRMLEIAPEAPRIDIAVDAAPLAARRMLEALLAKEA